MKLGETSNIFDTSVVFCSLGLDGYQNTIVPIWFFAINFSIFCYGLLRIVYLLILRRGQRYFY